MRESNISEERCPDTEQHARPAHSAGAGRRAARARLRCPGKAGPNRHTRAPGLQGLRAAHLRGRAALWPGAARRAAPPGAGPAPRAAAAAALRRGACPGARVLVAAARAARQLRRRPRASARSAAAPPDEQANEHCRQSACLAAL